jgi:hypothetical protein
LAFQTDRNELACDPFGVMECWSMGVMSKDTEAATPSLQHSIPPSLLRWVSPGE